MIHYHGTPLGGTRDEVARFVRRRHFLVPFPRKEDLPVVSECAASFCLDNGAFSLWKAGEARTNWKDWIEYFEWVRGLCRHPRYTFAIIPDIIDGSEADNDRLIVRFTNWDGWRGERWKYMAAPVWHLHESLERLDRLCRGWERVCLGSSGEYATPGTDKWTARMDDAFDVICDDNGHPRAKVHGLRMLRPSIVERYPFASCDSTNVAQNSAIPSRFPYPPPTQSQRREQIAWGIEAAQSPPAWVRPPVQTDLFELEES